MEKSRNSRNGIRKERRSGRRDKGKVRKKERMRGKAEWFRGGKKKGKGKER